MPAFLTTSGLQKFAVATPEQPMTVKYMAIGTGTGTPTENIGSLFNEVYRIEIPNPVRDPNNPRNLEFTGHIPTTVGGWTITELGLYDSNGVLVAYDLLPESIVKSSPDSALTTDMYPTVVIALSNAEETTLIVSSSIEFDHEALTGRSKANSHPISAIGGLQGALDQKTTDLNDATKAINKKIDDGVTASELKDKQNVKLTSDQEIAGVKTFSSPIVSSGANVTDIPLKNVTGLTKFKDEFDSIKTTKKITSNYTVLNTDSGILEVDASAGSIVITVAKSTDHITKRIIILRSDASANTVRINPSAGDTFNGEGLSYPYGWSHQYETIMFLAGVNYWTGIRSPRTSVGFDPANGAVSLIHKGAVSARIITTNEALGWGQTWQNMASSRTLGAKYTNSTGKPIQIAVSTRNTFQFVTAEFMIVTISDLATQFTGGGSADSGAVKEATACMVIPSGAEYSVSSSSSGGISLWRELR